MQMSKWKRTQKQASYIRTIESMIFSADSLSDSEDAIFVDVEATFVEISSWIYVKSWIEQ